jgi:hypothetical protein
VNPQQPAHHAKPNPDIIKFMKDVKSELGALRSIVLKLEAALSKTDTTQPGKEKSKKLHASLARQKNVKGQKGSMTAESGGPTVLPTTYLSSDESDQEEGEVHVANYARAAIQFPTFTRAEDILGPFHRTVVLPRDVIECGFPVRKKWFSELLHD